MPNTPNDPVFHINQLVDRALHICEQSTNNSTTDLLAEAQFIIFKQIPQDAAFDLFSERNSDFYKVYLKLSHSLAKLPPMNMHIEERFDRLKPTNNLPSNRSTQSSKSAKFLPKLVRKKPIPYPNSPTDAQLHMPTAGTEQQQQSPPTQGGEYHISPAILANKLAVADILLIDVRSRDTFEKEHIDSKLITCFEPATLKFNTNVNELEDSLVLAPLEEYECFVRRQQVDMIVLYDQNSKTFDDSVSLKIVADALKQVNLNCYILRGGFDAWCMDSRNKTTGVDVVTGSESPILKPDPPVNGGMRLNSGLQVPQGPRSMPDKRGFLVNTKHTQPILSSSVPKPALHLSNVNINTGASQIFDGYTDLPPKSPLSGLKIPKLLSSSKYRSLPSPPQPAIAPPSPLMNAEDQQNFKISSPVSKAVNANATTSSNANTSKPKANMNVIMNPALLKSTGLRNLGNTCYMNCIIQCLMSIMNLTEPFITGEYQNFINVNSKLGYKGQFAHEFAKLVRSMLQPSVKFISPIGMKNFAGITRPENFAGYEQQDCQEFLTFVLDGLHEDLNINGHKPKDRELDSAEERRREQLGIRVSSAIEWERYLKGDTSLIVDLFQGQYLSQLKCQTCKHTSTTYNSFSSLSLPIVNKAVIGHSSNLKSCFDEFVKPEILDHDNAWFCPNCKHKRRTLKTLQISRLPPVLVIHLKRFKRSKSGTVDKLETPVDYPLRNLDLTKYWPQFKLHEMSPEEANLLQQLPPRGQTPPFIYDLRAVTLHHGTLKGGHYTAIAEKPGSGWFLYDDSNVTPVKEHAAVSKNAYVLFYVRRM